MIQTYFGNGKGKTTAAVGAAIRYVGCGHKVLFVSFLKNNDSTELKILNTIPNLDILHSDVRYQLYDNQNETLTQKFTEGYTRLFQTVQANCKMCQMIILDEILDAVQFGYIDEKILVDFLLENKKHREIILTGHHLSDAVKTVSDYVSEVKAIKHPYDLGTPSRKGIEY